MPRSYSEEMYREREQIILDAAMKLFLEKEFSDISMRALARECKMANGTIFNYFETKEQLFRKLLYLQYLQYFQEELTRIQKAAFHDFPSYRAFVLEGTRSLLEHKQPLIALLGLHHNVFKVPDESDPLRDLYLEVVQALLALGKETHRQLDEISESDGVRLYFFLNSILVGYRNLFQSSGELEAQHTMGIELDPQKEITLAVERYLNGLQRQSL